MPAPKSSDSSNPKKSFSWQRLLIHCALFGVCALLGVLSWHISKPQSVRFYETKSDEHLTVKVTPEIEATLDSSSSFAITDNKPLRIELFRGNIYFDIGANSTEKLSVKIGETLIEDVGPRFSIRMQKDGSHIISVAQGQARINVASGTYLISALEQANFDGFRISKHKMISESDVAPWHNAHVSP